MARDPQSGSFNSKVVDEQTKAAAKRAAAKGPTPDEALLARAQAQLEKLKALPDPKATAAADRAAAVTAARLASSPIAQEAARTTAALKSFTAKGGLLGVPGSNIKTADPASLAKVGSNIFQMLGGVLYFSGVPFTGTSGNKKYENGIEVGITGLADEDEDETTTTALKTEAQIAADAAKAQAQGERQSAYDLLLQQFNQYGLGALVEPLKGLITSGASPAEFTIKLRETDAYKKRFAANAQRIQKGLTAISEAEYLGLEDQYQNIMRNYGLPAEYYTRGDMGVQEGFNKFIANDVSAAELEDRVLTAQSRVLNANPEVLASLKQFYPGITNGDILAYTLDPTKALTDIKRKVTAAEIGGAATQAGLTTGMTRAEELTAAGITKQQAQQGFQTIAEVAPRGGQLAEIYKQSPYTQTTAEAEVFGLVGSTEAARQRKKLTQLETAAFSGSAGAGAIARDRAGVL
jgi:hypothetical protein